MNSIFLILLNRKPVGQEINFLKDKNIDFIKNYIKNTQEFNNFYDLNLKKIENIFFDILKDESLFINSRQFMKIFINYKYNESSMRIYIGNLIDNVTNQYKNFYEKIFDLKQEISVNEIMDIINNNLNIPSYICNTQKYHTLCDLKISELV